MVKKTFVKKKAAKNPADESAVNSKFRARVRMYRQGLGDCFLITIPRKNGKPFYMLIDCGVILGTREPAAIMTKVVSDIIATTGGKVDVLAATHEHWDHLSGFVQAQEAFKKLKVDEVWMAWTEDPKDSLARKLRKERTAMRAALAVTETRLRFGGASDAADEVRSMLQFFGAKGGTTEDALTFVHKMSDSVRFCLPSNDPVKLGDTSVVAYVLGPPHDEKLIKKYNPSKSKPETYDMDSMDLYLSAVGSTLLEDDRREPFDCAFRIPIEAARQMPFFQDHYWGEDADSEEKSQSWRAIDGAWLASSTLLALQLDSATNNSSLVIALELDGGDVMLFAADAQVGNWLSWQDASWKVAGRAVTGSNLLERTILYKVGHHGSHNATLREKGLEMMSKLKVAMIPVDHEMAKKKGWGKMPLDSLVQRLEDITNGGVVRVDEGLPQRLTKSGIETELYFELVV